MEFEGEISVDEKINMEVAQVMMDFSDL